MHLFRTVSRVNYLWLTIVECVALLSLIRSGRIETFHAIFLRDCWLLALGLLYVFFFGPFSRHLLVFLQSNLFGVIYVSETLFFD